MKGAERAAALGFCALFLLLGLAWISRPGLQADEVLFSTGIYVPERSTWWIGFQGHPVSVMEMPYVGAMKTWLYAGIFALWAPSAASVRAPVVVAGAAAVWLVFLLMRRVAGRGAALVACGLLAVDPAFVWTVRCDWGPVAFQFLLCAAGLCALVRYYDTQRTRWLGFGFLLFGLALWNKAIFAWTLAGLAAGLLSTFRTAFTRRRGAIAALTLVLGASPLILYNLTEKAETLNRRLLASPSEIASKLPLLKESLEGQALYGYMAREPDLDEWGWVRRSPIPWLLAAAALVAWKSAAGRFFLVTFVVEWLTMAATHDGGYSLHHIVLLWPWPHCIIGTGVAEAARRWKWAYLPPLAAGLLSLAVTLRYHVLFARHGANPPWSEAIYSLYDELNRSQWNRVYVNDWGIMEQLVLLSRGKLETDASFVRPADFVTKREGWVIVSHVDRFEVLARVNRRIESVPGYHKQLLRVIKDRQGEDIYQIFRMAPASVDPPPGVEIKPVPGR